MRHVAVGTAALAVLFGLWLAWDVLSIKRDLEAGRDLLDDLTLDAVASEGIAHLAGQASDHLSSAAGRAHDSLPLRALSLVPGVDDQIRGVRRMADATAAIGRAGKESAARIDRQMGAAGTGAGRVELMDTALDELDRLQDVLGRTDVGSGTGLLPPLRRAHDDLASSIREARQKIDEGRDLIRPVRALLTGPTELLLLAANNAEMTGGAGMTLSAGGLSISDGELELGEVVRAGDLRLPRSVPIPDELRSIYRPTGLGIDLRSTTRSPDLTATGPVALRIMEVHGMDLDGVVVVDAVALQGLLAVTGPVEVHGKEITADTVLAEVLNENYLAFEGEARDVRVSYQGDIAKAVFDAVTTREVPAVDLAAALLDAAAGRHVLLWSEEPALQLVWEQLGVAGALDRNGLMVSFQNYGANKLDWFLRPESTLDVTLLPSGDFRARLTMRMPVPTRAEMDGTSGYVMGPSPDTHEVFLTVHLPAAAYDITTPDGDFRTAGEEPPMQVRTFLAEVRLGTTFERTVEFSLPRSDGGMTLLPSARVEPMPLTVDGVVTIDDDTPVTFTWRAAIPPPLDGAAPARVRVPALMGLAATAAASATAASGLVSSRRRGAPPSLPTATSWLAMAAVAAFTIAAALALISVWAGWPPGVTVARSLTPR